MVLLLLPLACARGHQLTATSEKTGRSLQAESGVDGDLRSRMGAIDRVLAQTTPIVDRWSRQGAIGSERAQIHRFTVDTKRRVVLVAIGASPRMALDLVVRQVGREGVVTSDVSPDRRAAVEWIAREDRTYAIEVRASDGSGQYRVGAFIKPSSTEPSPLNRLFDADPRYQRRFERVIEQLSATGYAPVAPPRRFMAIRHERFSFVEQLRQGRCYAFAAQGTAGIDDIELRLEADRRLVVADLSRRPEAWVKYCSEQDQRLRVVIEVRAGSGTIAWGVFSAMRDTVLDQVGPPLFVDTDAFTPLPESPRIEPGQAAPGLAVQLSQAKERFARHGMVPVGRPREMALTKRGHWATDLHLSQARCHGIAVASTIALDTVQILQESASAAQWSGAGLPALLTTCASPQGAWRVVAVQRAGAGDPAGRAQLRLMVFTLDPSVKNSAKPRDTRPRSK